MKRSARAQLSLLVLLVMCLAFVHVQRPLPARADSAGEQREPPEYRDLIGRAVREFDAGNFPEARGLFSKAHGVYPNARTYLGLGFTAFELRNYAISAESLEQALASNVKPLDAKLRKSAEDVLSRARGNLARVKLKLSPRSARVLVDGVPTRTDTRGELVLEVGDHGIEVQASGYLAERRTLSIVGGEQLELNVELSKPEVASADHAASASDASPSGGADQSTRRPVYKSPWLWVGLGALLVGGGVATFLVLRERDKTEPADPILSSNTPNGGVFQALRSW